MLSSMAGLFGSGGGSVGDDAAIGGVLAEVKRHVGHQELRPIAVQQPRTIGHLAFLEVDAGQADDLRQLTAFRLVEPQIEHLHVVDPDFSGR